MPWHTAVAILLYLVETEGIWARECVQAYATIIPKPLGIPATGSKAILRTGFVVQRGDGPGCSAAAAIFELNRI